MASTSRQRRRKPGPNAVEPEVEQRERVELGVAVGMTIEELCAAVDMPRRTFYRAFKRELEIGRARRLLASAARLDAMASAGNVAAAKYLHSLMLEGANKAEDAEIEDTWSDVVGEKKSILARISDFN
jgi:hypothetical protein